MTTREQDLAFGEWLRSSLRQIGSNPQQLARHLGVRTTQVSAWMAGRDAPTAEQCERLGSVLGVPSRLVRRRAGLLTLRLAETSDNSDDASPMPEPDEERSDAVATDDQALMPTLDESTPTALEETLAAVVQVEMAASPPVEEPPAARPARRRRPSPARPPAAPEPPQPTTLLDPARPAALRALADELEAAEQVHQAVQAEVERLLGEIARLEEENRHLQRQLDRVRSVVLGEEGGSTTGR